MPMEQGKARRLYAVPDSAEYSITRKRQEEVERQHAIRQARVLLESEGYQLIAPDRPGA